MAKSTIAKIQELLGATADGIWGPGSQTALNSEIKETPPKGSRTLGEIQALLGVDANGFWDRKSKAALSELTKTGGVESVATAQSRDEDQPKLSLSPSVQTAMRRVGGEPISATRLCSAIFELHNEYAAGAAGSLRLVDTPTKQAVQAWLSQIQALFDFSSIQDRRNSKISQELARAEAPTLHGRLLVVGLCLLEPRLREQLDRVGALEEVVKEIREPLSEILTDQGRALYESRAQSGPDLSESVPNWSDDPLEKPEDDLLGRRAFARFLAKRIAAISTQSGAYAMHVYGPWGAGKTTLLNFLRKELEAHLEDKNKWLVVEFNAWRQQQIQPPWWSLMERVFKTTKERLKWWERLQEYWWRFNTGRLQYVIGLILLAWILALVVFPLLRSHTEDAAAIKAFGANAESLSKILALAATIWGGVLAVNRSLLLGAAHAAQTYNELTHDPTTKIKQRFNDLIEKLSPKRVAILIDDLDRCQSRYVVELLEGVQTLFREAPVVFVIAADRHWLNACYEEIYEKLQPRIYEPGKPLGTLFLEKAFRFSTPMPGIPVQLKEAYWQHLLKLKATQQKAEITIARKKAREEVGNAQTENEVRAVLEQKEGRTFAEDRALREEAVVRLAAPEVLERLEHTLKPYAPLLEPNPRAMKLFVNTYSANRALAILSEIEIELPQLALWTILCSRWPQLADYLTDRPEMLERLRPDGAKVPDALKSLWQEPHITEISKAIRGETVDARLTIETLKLCKPLRS